MLNSKAIQDVITEKVMIQHFADKFVFYTNLVKLLFIGTENRNIRHFYQ